MADDYEHGRPGTGGYQRHKKRDEDPCGPCRAAWNAYHQRYLARRRAKTMLARRHPEEYEALLQAELAKEAER